jgi:hypothetical protein
MTTSRGSVETATPPLDPVRAVATFFREDPSRILAVASRLRGPDRSLESTVEGLSMGRTLPPGSRIRIDFVERDGYEVGEVVAFVAGGQVVVHRVVYRGRAGPARGYVLTRGDAPLAPDAPVPERSIIGAVGAVQRDGRWEAVGGRPWQTRRARVVRALLLVWVAGVLRVSPRVAHALAFFLHRSERALRGARARRRAGRPRGSAPSRAA